tara:strand:+ start:101 stop:475 length:375 start_codon:yes stop_codon:yes gene_type:complete
MNKLNEAYKSIGEVAEILNLKDKKTGKLNTHTIRFWEKNFKQIKPKFFNNNRRYYDKNSIKILFKIQYLLKEEGMTILGVKKLLNSKKIFNLDGSNNKTITTRNNNLYLKLNKISKIIKEIKDI